MRLLVCPFGPVWLQTFASLLLKIIYVNTTGRIVYNELQDREVMNAYDFDEVLFNVTYAHVQNRTECLLSKCMRMDPLRQCRKTCAKSFCFTFGFGIWLPAQDASIRPPLVLG